MPDWIVKYWVQWLFGFVGAGFTGITAYMKQKFKKQKALEDGVKALLHDKLFQESGVYLESGSITHDELDNLRYVYDAYHNLGGNGTGTKAFEDVEKLPLKTNRRKTNEY